MPWAKGLGGGLWRVGCLDPGLGSYSSTVVVVGSREGGERGVSCNAGWEGEGDGEGDTGARAGPGREKKLPLESPVVQRLKLNNYKYS
jgi:hypothetical protein